jgi:hypothetical protein
MSISDHSTAPPRSAGSRREMPCTSCGAVPEPAVAAFSAAIRRSSAEPRFPLAPVTAILMTLLRGVVTPMGTPVAP